MREDEAMTDTTYRTVTPYLLVNDADAELRFLEAAFAGIVRHCSRTPEGRVMHAEVTIGDSLVMLGQCGPEWPGQALRALPVGGRRGCDVGAGTGAGGTEESKPGRQAVRPPQCGRERSEWQHVVDRRALCERRVNERCCDAGMPDTLQRSAFRLR